MSNKNIMLYLSSSPDDQSNVGVDKEFRAIYENVDRHFFNMFSVSSVQASDVQSIIVKNNPEIVHFAGHALAESIFFEDRKRKGVEVSKDKFTNIFQNLKKKPRLVFLNACWTSEKIEQLTNIIDFVIATKREVLDTAAIVFAAKFYENLSLKMPVKSAFNLAKNQFDINKESEKVEMYDLCIHKNADENEVFIKPPQSETKENGENVTNTINIGEGNKFRDMTSFQGDKFGDITIKK